MKQQTSNINIDTSKLNIIYFNVGKADSSLILYKDKVILIDVGNESDGEKIVEFLKAKGIIQIDYLIGTHIHEDHRNIKHFTSILFSQTA